jgi:hypothetical protein
MLPDQPMSTLSAAYDSLARQWTHDELAARYDGVRRRGEQLAQDQPLRSPIGVLATAVPACASLDVAVHALHVLPDAADAELFDRLLDSTDRNIALALRRLHEALELDGETHGYRADEWLPVVCDTAAPILLSARLEREPPAFVECAEQAVRWLSRAIVDLDQDAPDAAAAIVDGLARLLALHVFADLAGGRRDDIGT